MTGKLPINIDHLLRQRTIEGERIEYKAGWNPQSVLHTICAFANDFHNLGGGYVVLGVEEQNGRPILPPKGIRPDAIDATQQELLNLGHAAIQPHYHPLTATYNVDGQTILVLWVLQSQSESERGAQRLGLLHSQTQQHGSRQGSRRA
ncbi:MAG: ATP-binding protein [Candidatus Latescibacteria bacterium]|nr:ATP-binding protein [Candidatus Latescibacterota bacterium]